MAERGTKFAYRCAQPFAFGLRPGSISMTHPLSRAAAAALLTAAAFGPAALAPGQAQAAPAVCAGLVLGGAGGVLIDPYGGGVGCVIVFGAALALSGGTGAAADLPIGSTTTYAYDSVGALTTSTDSGGTQTTYTYDSVNRLSEVQESGAPDPRLRYTYDASSNVLTTVEMAGRTTQYTYDAQHRVTQVEDADTGAGTTTTYQYDYNPSGLVQTVTDPSAGGGVVYQYDYNGTVLRETTDGSGNVTRFTYDSLSRLTEIVVVPAAPADPNIRTTYDYDPMDRIIRTTHDADGSPVVTQYQYDPVSHLMSSTDNGTVLPLYFVTFEAEEAPEPAAVALFCGGVLMLARSRRRRQ